MLGGITFDCGSPGAPSVGDGFGCCAGESDEETAHELCAGDATISGMLIRCTENTMYD